MRSTTITKTLLYLSGIGFIFFLYFIIVISNNNSFIYPEFNKIWNALSDIVINNTFLNCFGMSILRVLISIGITFIISIIISFIYILIPSSLYFFKPLIVVLKASPLAVLSMYLFIGVGSEKAPYIITILMTLPICIEGFISSINNIDKNYIYQLKTESVPKIIKFFKVYIPLIFPYIIMCLLQTFGLGVKVMIMGEYLCQTSNSLGEVIYLYKTTYSFDYLLSILIIIVVFVLLIEGIIKLISDKIIKTR